MTVPAVVKVDRIMKKVKDGEMNVTSIRIDPAKPKVWVAARPVPYDYGIIGNLWHRFKLAFLVLIGRYDALEWEGQ